MGRGGERSDLARELDLGPVLRSNWSGIAPGPWHRVVQADWLGPFTPTRVAFWTLKLMREDPQLSLGLNALKAPFFSIDYRLRGGTPQTRAFVNQALRESPLFDRLLLSILNALDFGFQSHELIWDVANVVVHHEQRDPELFPSSYVLSDFYDIDPERVSTIKTDEFGRMVGLVCDLQQELPIEKLLHAVHLGEWRNWWGTPQLKRAYNPWYWANWLYLYHMRYMEGKANPPYVGTAPVEPRNDEDLNRSGQTPHNALDVLGQQMTSLRGGGAAALPWEPDEKGQNKWSIRVLEDAGRADQFIQSINHMQALKLRALCLPERTATQDTETGSFAMVREHVDMFLQILEGWKRHLVLPALNQVAALLVRNNFGRSAAVPTWDASELSRLRQGFLADLIKAALDVPQTLEDGRVYTPGQLIDFEAAFESLNIHARKAWDVARKAPVLPPAPQAPPPPAPGVAKGKAEEAGTTGSENMSRSSMAPRERDQIVINMPQQPTPDVTVNVEAPRAPDVNLSVEAPRAPNVTVKAPITNLVSPQVSVPTPIVNVESPDVTVNVAAPQPVKRDVQIRRDENGRIVGADVRPEA